MSSHQRFCDEYQESQEDDESDSTDTPTVSTAVADYFEGLELDAFERDDGQCRRCGESETPLTVEKFYPSREGLANLVTLCEKCDDNLSGLNPRTKRSKVNR